MDMAHIIGKKSGQKQNIVIAAPISSKSDKKLKTLKSFISAPGLARAILSVFLDHSYDVK